MEQKTTLRTQIESIVSVMGTINDEWAKDANEGACTKEEFDCLYNDLSNILAVVEEMELAINLLKKHI